MTATFDLDGFRRDAREQSRRLFHAKLRQDRGEVTLASVLDAGWEAVAPDGWERVSFGPGVFGGLAIAEAVRTIATTNPPRKPTVSVSRPAVLTPRPLERIGEPFRIWGKAHQMGAVVWRANKPLRLQRGALEPYGDVRLLWSHDENALLASVGSGTLTLADCGNYANVLMFWAALYPRDSLSRRLIERFDAGDKLQCSLGYTPLAWQRTWQGPDEIDVVTSGRLNEISIVENAAQDGTAVRKFID